MKYPQTTGIASPYANNSVRDAGCYDEAPDAPSNTRIRDRVTSLEIQMSDLHGLISSLERRLDTVVTPVPPSVASVGGVKADPIIGSPNSHLFDRLETLSRGVTEAQGRLSSLLSRIEV